MERCPFCGSEIYPGAEVCAGCDAERERRGTLSGVIIPLVLFVFGVLCLLVALSGILTLLHIIKPSNPLHGFNDDMFAIFFGGPVGFFCVKIGLSLFRRGPHTGRWVRRSIQ